MKANELRKLSAEELEAKQAELTKELFNLKFQLHTGHLENSAKISTVRRTIAQVKTILCENKA